MKLKNNFKNLQLRKGQLPQPKRYSERESFDRINRAIKELDVPTERLQILGDWAQRVIANPQEWNAMREWLVSNGVESESLSMEPDMQRLAGLVALAETAKRNASART